MKQLLLLLLIISAIGCSEKKKENVMVAWSPIDTASPNIQLPFKDTYPLVKQTVWFEDGKYYLNTKYQTEATEGGVYYHKDYLKTLFPFDSTISGSFNYIVRNKKRMYQTAWTFVKTKAAREKAIADSIKMIENLPVDSNTYGAHTMFDLQTGTYGTRIGGSSDKRDTAIMKKSPKNIPIGDTPIYNYHDKSIHSNN